MSEATQPEPQAWKAEPRYWARTQDEIDRGVPNLSEASAREIVELHNETKALREALRWIPVEERLPDEDAAEFRYLVHYLEPSLRKGKLGRMYTTIAGYGPRRNDHCKEVKEGWRWETHFYELGMLQPCTSWIDTVTHWMPLPAPPEAVLESSGGKDKP